MLDALEVKCREDGRTVNARVVHGVAVLRRLVARGVVGVRLVTSDALRGSDRLDSKRGHLYDRLRRRSDVARPRKPKTSAEEPEAISLEDEEPLAYIGEEAYAPIDTGSGPADEDLEPPDIAEEEEPPLEVPLR